MSNDFVLGQRVRFTRPMSRRRVPVRDITVEESIGGCPYTRTMKINKEWTPNDFIPPTEGIIVGKRTLSNGYSQWEEYGYEYSPATHFTAWMVVTDLRSAPVHVLPEHITAIPMSNWKVIEESEPTHEGWDPEHFRVAGCDGSLHPDDCLESTPWPDGRNAS
jgi:hypothetical protein